MRTLSSSAVVLVCAGLEEGYDRKPTDADRAAQGLSPSVKTQEDHLRMWAARLRTVESKRGGYSHVRDLLVKLWLAEHPELRADVGLPNNRAAWLNGEITKFLAASEPRAEVEA